MGGDRVRTRFSAAAFGPCAVQNPHGEGFDKVRQKFLLNPHQSILESIVPSILIAYRRRLNAGRYP